MRRFLAISTGCMLLHHLALWAVVIHAHGLTWEGALSNWDSNWYERIIHQGYGGDAWAFYPLYPALVWTAAVVVPVATPVLGSLLSAGALLGFVWLVGRLIQRDGGRYAGLVPATRLGWFFFLYSPATYVFHSHHTEAVYLLMSAAALVLVAEKRWLWASVLAGLCALTKNQGVFLAVAIASGAAWQMEGWGRKARVFAVSGLVSGCLWGLFPLYAYLRTGDAFAFAHAQAAWRPEV
jgi:Gpi18-like mannosyltransferase